MNLSREDMIWGKYECYDLAANGAGRKDEGAGGEKMFLGDMEEFQFMGKEI